MNDKVLSIRGNFMMASGEVVRFVIHPETLQQWGAPTSTLGLTSDLLGDLSNAAWEHLAGANDTDDADQ